MQQRLSKTSNLLGFDESEMLCFFLQVNVMHLKCQCQFSLSSWTVATVNASNVWNFEDRIATHWAHLSYGILKNTQTKHSVCTVCRRHVDTKDQTEEGGCWLRQCMRGCIHDHQGRRAVAHHPEPTTSFALQQTGEQTNTEWTVAYPPHPHSPPHSVCCPHTVSVAVPMKR